MDQGFVEVTASRTEKIGLPNWSSISLLASAKTVVPMAEYDEASSFLALVVDTFINERCESIARNLNIWAGIKTNTLDQGTKAGIVPQGLSIVETEITFSRIEVVGLPEKSNINLLESAKTVVVAGLELAGFEELSERVNKRMGEKRDVVLANQRPWTNTA